MTPQFHFDVVSEALTELESLHPELLENLPLPENVAQSDISTLNNELTDEEMIQSMEQWEEEMNDAFDSYDYLLEDEVHFLNVNTGTCFSILLQVTLLIILQ